MTNTTAKLELENLLLRAVVDSKDAEIQRLQRENDWLSLQCAGLKSKHSVTDAMERLGIPEEDPEVLRARDLRRG